MVQKRRISGPESNQETCSLERHIADTLKYVRRFDMRQEVRVMALHNLTRGARRQQRFSHLLAPHSLLFLLLAHDGKEPIIIRVEALNVMIALADSIAGARCMLCMAGQIRVLTKMDDERTDPVAAKAKQLVAILDVFDTGTCEVRKAPVYLSNPERF